jgi:hypothetical protein
MASLLTSAQSKLKILRMPLTDDSRVANAVAVNETLDELTLFPAGPLPTGLIFHVLHTNVHLQELCLWHDESCIDLSMSEVDAALSLYLSRTKTLSHLYLHSQLYDRERTQHLVNGLQWNTSLTKVTVQCCLFDAEAVEVLKAFALVVGPGSTMKTINEATIISGDRYKTPPVRPPWLPCSKFFLLCRF